MGRRRRGFHISVVSETKLTSKKHKTFLNVLGNMGYMSVKDENFPRAQGVLRGKQQDKTKPTASLQGF